MGKIVKCFFMSFVLLTISLITFNISIAEAIDSDNDGWSDQYEKKLGADPKDSRNTPDPLADNDIDGLVNEKERDYGTDPTDPDTDNDSLSDSQEVAWEKSDPRDSDTDNDGLNDFNEILNGTNPRLPDSDGDGWLDKAEVDAGSDPNNYSSTPKDP
jgi:Bacterial TSP3 repeat